jgi:tRNA A-37 threonylcarbamoyl transferase component Bud32
MNPINSRRTNLFDEELDDTFLRSLKKDIRPNTTKKSLEGYFYVLSLAQQPTYFKYYFELHDNYIFCKKEASGEEMGYMDIKNAFMKLTYNTKINGEDHIGIKFSKKSAYEEILSPNKTVVNEWFEYLKRYCILSKFRQYFETIKTIGKGNFAKVILVERKTDLKQFAVKIFSKNEIMADALERKCLIYEIKMMREMNHPRVLKLHEMYLGESYIYCLCELYKGADLLNSIIKKGSQPESKALTIIFQIMEGLAYMHSKKIIHRDIKPENIIFKGTQENIDIAIVDLGFATFEEDFRKLFVRCGTPGYVAPEVLNDKDYNCKADVFSAGVIFYIMFYKQIDRHNSFQWEFL